MRNAPPTWFRQPSVALALALAAATACDRSRPSGSTGGEATPGSDPSAIEAGLRWNLHPSDSSVTLRLLDASGAPLLHLGCRQEPPRLEVVVETFTPIASEERLSLGVDDEPFVFVAHPEAPRAGGVQGEAPVHPQLLERLPSARAISAVYGAQVLGPYMPPEPEMAATWVTTCRGRAAR